MSDQHCIEAVANLIAALVCSSSCSELFTVAVLSDNLSSDQVLARATQVLSTTLDRT